MANIQGRNIKLYVLFCVKIYSCILLHINPTRHTIHRVYFYVTTALRVSGVTITHRQEYKTTVTTASGNRYTVLLSVAIVEESTVPR